jgi:uncharacterized protein YcgI (DUF1989 family)
MTMPETAREFVIPAGHARLWRMRAGERVTIGQTEGHQVGDLIAFDAADLTEFLSTSHTRRCLSAWRIGRGQCLFTNHRREILEIVEDTLGVHDILAAACDPYRYRRDFGVEGHRSCRTNFVEVLAPHDIPDWRVPDPVNLFQNSPVLPDGRYLSAASAAGPTDFVTLLARLDLIAACSACPQDLAPTNAGRVTDLRVRLS